MTNYRLVMLEDSPHLVEYSGVTFRSWSHRRIYLWCGDLEDCNCTPWTQVYP